MTLAPANTQRVEYTDMTCLLFAPFYLLKPRCGGLNDVPTGGGIMEVLVFAFLKEENYLNYAEYFTLTFDLTGKLHGS